MTQYRYIGEHPTSITMGETVVPVEPLGFVDLSEEDAEVSENKSLIEDGMLVVATLPQTPDIEVEPEPEPEPPAKKSTTAKKGGEKSE